ncbi:MAG TPA: hypothetical protein VFZ21_22955 [Gemmatimonadaceae bacterium]|jgi:hypothetical protein|nr:hypothetical protein [Gemmatimonadaceae bacterium]
MRPLALIGIVLLVAGAVVLAMGGFGFTKERQEVDVGPIEVAAERRGFVPPVVGGLAMVVGAVMLFAARRARR